MNLTLCLNTLFDECDNVSPLLSSGKQRKIRLRLKSLSNQMSNYGLIAVKWAQFGYFEGLLLVFSHGTISSVCFSADGTITNVYHEKFVHTKLPSYRVSSIEIQDGYILISHIEPYLTHISLETNFDRSKKYLKFKLKSSCAMKTVSLGRNNRHLLSKRNLAVSEEHALLWWNTTLFSNWFLGNNNHNHIPNLLLFRLDSLNIVASEAIEGEIIKVPTLGAMSCNY